MALLEMLFSLSFSLYFLEASSGFYYFKESSFLVDTYLFCISPHLVPSDMVNRIHIHKRPFIFKVGMTQAPKKTLSFCFFQMEELPFGD